MFERFAEKARRVIFFARYEASVWGATQIEPSHLLLGLLREDKGLFLDLLYDSDIFANAAEAMGLQGSESRVDTSVDMPLSSESQHVLVCAAEEAELLAHEQVRPGHLLLGLLREPGAARDLLEKRGLTLAIVREYLRASATPQVAPEKRQTSGEIRVHYTPSPNERIIGELREQFSGMMGRLKPELEPAVSFTLHPDNRQ